MTISMKICRNMLRAHRRCLNVKGILLLALAIFIMCVLIKRIKTQSTATTGGDSGMKVDAGRQHHPSYHGDDEAGVMGDAAGYLRKRNISIHERNHLEGQLMKRNNTNLGRHDADTFRGKTIQKDVIVNPHNFAMLINEPRKCMNDSGGTKPVFLLVLVLTAHKNFRLRKAVRETWGSVTDIDGKNIVTLFLLGRSTNKQYERAVTKESSEFRDIIIEDFADSYKNLTLKVIMGFNWVTEFCSHAKYIMKTDDDMFVSYENLVRYLRLSKTPSSRFVTGRTIHEAPIRNPNSKWYIPISVYERNMFPPFCSGSGYVMSGDVAPMVARTSLYIPYLHLEDVFVGLCLERLGIRPRRHIQFNNGNVKYSYCRYKTVFTAHLSVAFVEVIYEIWKDLNTTKSFHCNIPFWPGNDPMFV